MENTKLCENCGSWRSFHDWKPCAECGWFTTGDRSQVVENPPKKGNRLERRRAASRRRGAQAGATTVVDKLPR